MKLVISVFRHVLTPFAMIFAVIAGFLAAGVSALVEFFVLQQWLRPESKGLVFIPLLVVIALEGVKLFLHFAEAAFEQNQFSDEDKASLQGFLSALPYIKWGLVGFSVVCTLIFTASSFYYKVPGGETESIQQAKAEIEAEHDHDLQTVVDEADRVYQDKVNTAFIPVQAAQDYFDSITIVYTPWYEYERSTEAKEAAQQALQAAQLEYIAAQDQANQERTAFVEAARQTLDSRKNEELTKLEQSELALVAGDNQYLSSFLLFFSHTFFGQSYTRASYYIWVVMISLALSVLLEGVISLSQRVITLPEGVLAAISKGTPIKEGEKEKATRFVRYLTNAFIALAVFLMYGGLMEVSYNNIQLGAALVCSLITALIPSAIFNTTEPKADTDKFKRFFQKVAAEAQAVTVKGLISFAGFMLIGMLFGETFASLSVSAIGISVGNIVGHTLHLIPSNNPVAAQV